MVPLLVVATGFECHSSYTPFAVFTMCARWTLRALVILAACPGSCTDAHNRVRRRLDYLHDPAAVARAYPVLPATWANDVQLVAMGTHGKTFRASHGKETLAVRVEADRHLIDTTLSVANAGLTPGVVNYSYAECELPPTCSATQASAC